MSTRDIAAHLTRLYGVEVGRDTISRVTDAVLEDIQAWRSRPLDELYPIVYFDALTVKVKEDRSVQNRCCYLAVGVNLEGERDCLGIWWQDKEGAKFWLAVLNDLAHRGVKDILIACGGRPHRIPRGHQRGLPRDLGSDLHRARDPRLDQVRQLPGPKKVTAALRPIYTAANEQDALSELERFDAAWGAKYPMITDMWRRDWEHIIPFLSLPAPLRKAVYTTNSIEGLHRQVRKAIKTRGHFPDEQAATKLIYLAIQRAETKWRSVQGWTSALRALKIHFGDRIPD
jgi:putative transposase